VALTLAAGAILTGGFLAWKVLSTATKTTHGSVFDLLSTTPLKGEDTGRVNLLLAGNSADDPGHGGSDLTDSIMIVSLDTKTNTAFTLSIPRDLWVKIPGHGYGKINSVYVAGQNDKFSEDGYPDGGMGLLEKVVEQNFDIDLNYYSLVNYSALKNAVNAVGGIDVTIASSDSRGIYDPNISKSDGGPLRLTNGLHHLDGQTALSLARARNDPPGDGRIPYGLPNGDFDRAASQRLILTALKTKIFSMGTLSNPLKLSQLMDSVGDGLTTDIKTKELQRFYQVTKAIDNSKIQSLSLTDQKLISDYAAPGGQSALIPSAGLTDYSQIQAYLRQLTSSDPVVREGAKIIVLNGSGITGLAKQEAAKLTGLDLNVLSYATATTGSAATTIVDTTGGKKSATTKKLQTLYGGTISTNTALAKTTGADIIITFGADQAAKATSQPTQ
jgi:LCP family protein required for cell wall assembly